MIHSSESFNINNKTIYWKHFLDTCLGIELKMKSLESSSLEIWIYLSNESFSSEMGLHNIFARKVMDQTI